MSLALLELELDTPGDAGAGSTRRVGRTDERACRAFDDSELGVAGTLNVNSHCQHKFHSPAPSPLTAFTRKIVLNFGS